MSPRQSSGVDALRRKMAKFFAPRVTELIGFINPEKQVSSGDKMVGPNDYLLQMVRETYDAVRDGARLYRGVNNYAYIVEALLKKDGRMVVKGGGLDHPRDMIGLSLDERYARIWVEGGTKHDGFLLEFDPRRLSTLQPKQYLHWAHQCYYADYADLRALTDENKAKLLKFLSTRVKGFGRKRALMERSMAYKREPS